eukprot:CAMPEP_0170144688 /NCGR_PEP_ID=MMETSP0033_2-20121228/15329_1 /TAXON_ID=195969 /ORGANISM="Dolichomastix tenuilepis, Strain CCMP3274" /LENGTH=169 /DNA_ID=CAMNT_0010381209 /DNA_START=126 /DNA_END=637 /DNA_ORIENTATION=-
MRAIGRRIRCDICDHKGEAQDVVRGVVRQADGARARSAPALREHLLQLSSLHAPARRLCTRASQLGPYFGDVHVTRLPIFDDRHPVQNSERDALRRATSASSARGSSVAAASAARAPAEAEVEAEAEQSPKPLHPPPSLSGAALARIARAELASALAAKLRSPAATLHS